MYKIIISGILLITSLIFTTISLPHYDNKMRILISLFAIIVGGIVIGYFVSAWSKCNMIKKFKESLKVSIGISSLIYLAGYIFASIQGLF
jgi:hypothetical protein